MMALAFVLSAVFVFAGLWLSYVFNLTSGASIIMIAAAAFFLHHAVEHLKNGH